MNKLLRIDIAKLVLRVIFGGSMLTHGMPKLFKLLEGDYSFADPLGIGPELSLVLTVFAEVLCAALILIGFKTKWAAIPLIITMIVAAFFVHGGDPFADREMAILYLGGYLAIWGLGAGWLSLDGLLKK